MTEECGLIAKDLRQIGILNFEFEGDPTIMEVHVFETSNFTGEIVNTDGNSYVLKNRRKISLIVEACSDVIYVLLIIIFFMLHRNATQVV